MAGNQTQVGVCWLCPRLNSSLRENKPAPKGYHHYDPMIEWKRYEEINQKQT